MANMTVKEMASFILANCDLLNEFDIDKAYARTVRARIKADYGVYVDENQISDRLSFDENWKRYFEKEISPKFKDIEEYKFYQAIRYVGSKIFGIEDNGDTIKTSGMHLGDFIYLMLYVVFGELGEDLKHAHDIQDATGMKYDVSNFPYTNLGAFGAIQFKRFNNGKFQIKGLNEEQKERLQKVYEICHRR